jgi:hypothetical protein
MNFFETLSFLLIYICLPIAGILTLIYIIILLNQLTLTIRDANKVVADVQKKLDILQGPINTVGDVHKKYLKIIGAVSAAFTSVPHFKKSKKNKDE